VTQLPVMQLPVIQLPVAHAHAITFGTTSLHHLKYGLSCAYMYEQWNSESNLYRVTIELLPHFSLLICAISRD
jgi:hypothetical protein